MDLVFNGTFEVNEVAQREAGIVRPARRPPTRFRLRLYTLPDGHAVAIATEIASNPGMSITNAASLLSHVVRSHWQLPAERFNWVEHYRDRPERPGEDPVDRYAVVDFRGPLKTEDGEMVNISRMPRWCAIGRAELEALIDATLDESDCPFSYGG